MREIQIKLNVHDNYCKRVFRCIIVSIIIKEENDFKARRRTFWTLRCRDGL